MNDKLSLEIYKKDFNVKPVGYDSLEVDKYLDTINEGVERLEKELAKANEKIKQLTIDLQKKESEITSLNINITNLRAGSVTHSNHIDGQSNIEVLKRLSNLEKMVADIKLMIDSKSKDDRSI